MSKLHIIIPARSGSVGVPDKNIATVGGLPLLLRAYRVARSLPFDSQVTVSTDSRRYLEMVAAEGYGPLALRPSKLCTSTSHVIDTVLYELDQAQASDDSLCLLLEPSFVGRR